MSGRFEGKVAVITGGYGAIGREIASRFYAEGAQVVYADGVAADDLELQERQWFCKTDVADEDSVRALMQFTEKNAAVWMFLSIAPELVWKNIYMKLNWRNGRVCLRSTLAAFFYALNMRLIFYGVAAAGRLSMLVQ